MRPSKTELGRMSRRAYVNEAIGITKVIFGNDEYEVVYNDLNGIEAQNLVSRASYDINDVKPAVIDGYIVRIREKQRELGENIVDILNKTDKQVGMYHYSAEVRNETMAIAHEITSIKTYGLKE